MQKNLIENPRLVAAANPAINKKEDFELVFKEIVSDELDELADVNLNIYSKIKDDADFGRKVKEMLLNNVYKRLVPKE